MAEPAWCGGGVRVLTYGRAADEITDLIKALCFITGRNYDDVGQPKRTAGEYWEPGEWNDWGFFEFKAHKKGTVHFRFKNRDDWAALNRRYAKIKGQSLPAQL